MRDKDLIEIYILKKKKIFGIDKNDLSINLYIILKIYKNYKMIEWSFFEKTNFHINVANYPLRPCKNRNLFDDVSSLINHKVDFHKRIIN